MKFFQIKRRNFSVLRIGCVVVKTANPRPKPRRRPKPRPACPRPRPMGRHTTLLFGVTLKVNGNENLRLNKYSSFDIVYCMFWNISFSSTTVMESCSTFVSPLKLKKMSVMTVVTLRQLCFPITFFCVDIIRPEVSAIPKNRVHLLKWFFLQLVYFFVYNYIKTSKT